MQATAEHLRRLPKVELHCHVEGAARASTIADLARQHDITLPTDNLASLFTFTSLNQFLQIYEIVCRAVVDVEGFRRITYEALEDGARAGVRYREMFFSPGFNLRLGVPTAIIWEGIKAGIADAHADLDIRCRMILDFDKPTGPAHAIEMAEFAVAEPDRDLLIGLGADSEERDVEHLAFLPAYELAARHGLHRTMHAGEDGPVEVIRTAVRELGCERIDHGFRLLDDEAFTREMVDRQIPLTVCPTSNVVIANLIPDVAAHPFARMRELGVNVTLNSDDPGMMQFDLADEYVSVQSAFGYDLIDMEAISLAGVDASWAPADEKAAMRTRFLREFADLRAEFGLPATAVL